MLMHTSMSGPKNVTLPATRSLAFATPLLLIVFALILAGCGKSGNGSAGGIHVKAPGMDERDIAAKSGATFASTKSFTDKDNKITTAATYRVYVASYDLDTSQFARSMDKPMTADDQARVVFSLVGEEGGNEKSPLKAGTYSAKADKYLKIEEVSIVTRKNGQDNKVVLDRSDLAGEVRVTAVSGDSVSGELNLTGGETSIKGPFTAKILMR